jgi:hypothetical protein
MSQRKDIYSDFLVFSKFLQSRIPGVGSNQDEVEKAFSSFLRKLHTKGLATCPPKNSFWHHHFFACRNISGSFAHFMGEKEVANSMVFIRLLEIERLLLEYRILDRTCSYYSICRQLRFMMESILQAYYVDMNFSQLDLLEKIPILKQMKEDRKAIGGSLLKEIDLNMRIKMQDYDGKDINLAKQIKNLYRELSDTIHPDYKDYVPFSKNDEEVYFDWISRYTFTPNPKLSSYCLEKLNQVMDVIYLLVFDNFRGYAFVVFGQIRDILLKANCHLSLCFIKSFASPESSHG